MTGTFEVGIAPGGVVKFDHRPQFDAFCRKMAGESGELACIDIYPRKERKSRAQEKGFHAMLKPWVAEGHRIEDLKRFLLEDIFGLMEATNPITGEVVMVLREPHTSKLSMAQYSELIDGTLIRAAENGVILQAPDEYKRQKEEREQREARAAAKAQKGEAA